MLRKQFTTGLIAVIAIISTALLVGARFDAIWAGGEGYNAHQTAIISNEYSELIFKRGETVSTMADGVMQDWQNAIGVEFGAATIWMDRDTEIKFIDGRPGRETIQVLQGRVVVDGNLTIEVRELDLEISGVTSFVHYSWLNEIEIANISGTTRLTREDRSESIQGAIKTTTLPPYVDESISFEPEQSDAADFYTTVLN